MTTTTTSSTSTSGLISSLGVGSGLDLSSLLDSLQEVEDQKLTAITTKQTSYEAKITAYGTLQSALETYATATEALSDSSLYTVRNTSTNTAFTSTATSSAATGSYSINVTQLATAQTLAANAQSSKTTELGTSGLSDRTLTIQVGSGTAVDISLTDDQTTLTGIADAINSSDAGVTASIVQSGDSSYQLTITSDTTGSSSTMTISSNDSALNSILGYDSSTSTGGMTETVTAQNAKLTANGISIERSSNTITDVPAEGITLTLSAVSTSSENLVVSKSITDTVSAISDWVDAYNTLLTSFSTLSSYTSVSAGEDQSDDNGALVGDSVLRSVKTQLKSLLSHAQSSGTYKVISELGISIGASSTDSTTGQTTTGKLTLDDETLINALTENSSAVSDFFVGDGTSTGLATQMLSAVNSFTDDDGVISNAEDNLQTIVDKLSKQYTSVQSSIDSTMARYKAQFVKLDVLVSELNSTSDYLTSAFDQLTSSSSS
ncbi:flagellar filament capping protein FliD [Pectobacteriaceae bacterium CE70]|nr:flagellar filament capping protein FliD [Pectobacteriaceae bacterium C52]WJV68605.1 flagellar filament capping protein FliD [Pectobacteriaceae bacterium CE70]WJY12534.1 flagellar filament capping protein FliD [Pectobacteriaceae bacterium C80]